jgi:hypothetical protein
MLEREMEDLLWRYPAKLLHEDLKPFQRQPRSSVGRADLVFEDRLGGLLVVELKRGKLERAAISQVHDYFGMLKRQFPDRPVEMMVVAQTIPEERRIALTRYDIDFREVSEKQFRDLAKEVGYEFASEATPGASDSAGYRTNEGVPITTPANSQPQTDQMPGVGAFAATHSHVATPPDDFPPDLYERTMKRLRTYDFKGKAGKRALIWTQWPEGCSVAEFMRLARLSGGGAEDLRIYLSKDLISFDPQLTGAERNSVRRPR